MLELSNRKTNCETIDVVVRTNEGEIIVSKEENESIYIGTFEKDNDQDNAIEFTITKENYDIYKMFYDSFNELCTVEIERDGLPYIGSVNLISDDFKPTESSSLTISFDEETENIKLLFEKSQSKEWKNTYFIKLTNIEFISAPEYKVFKKLYSRLRNYSPRNRQIHFEEYLYQMNNGIAKTRKRSGK